MFNVNSAVNSTPSERVTHSFLVDFVDLWDTSCIVVTGNVNDESMLLSFLEKSFNFLSLQAVFSAQSCIDYLI